MSSNPVNQPIKDPFLRWRQEMEAKQEEHPRQMAELSEHANHLLQENERLLARLETNGVENPQVAAQPIPLTRADKGKGPALLDHSDHPADDEHSRAAPRFPIVHYLRTMRRPNPGRDLLTSPTRPLVLHTAEHEGRPT